MLKLCSTHFGSAGCRGVPVHADLPIAQQRVRAFKSAISASPEGSRVAGAQYLVRFAVEEWSPHVSLGAIFNKDQSINSGFAVDTWRPSHFGSGFDQPSRK